MKYILYFIFLILLCNIALAATIHGNIFSYELDLNTNSIVSINTTPRQTIVAKDSSYSFELDPGTYEIIAFERKDNITLSSSEEIITIVKDGDYTVDLILFPLIEEEEISDLDLEDIYIQEKDYKNIIIIALITAAIILSIIAIVYYKKFLKRKKETIQEHKEEKPIEDLADKVLEFIKKEEGRTTQKDIRKKFPLSEAKISLVIAELEHKGKIQKIKKGRGNIIILKQ